MDPIAIPPGSENRDRLLRREWLVTNGLGGYASGTLGGAPTRRYHGLLMAALPAPHGRWAMLNHLDESLILPGQKEVQLVGYLRKGGPEYPSAEPLRQFQIATGLPTWRYEVDGIVLEKQLLMPYQQNTVYVRYRLLEGKGPVQLRLVPWIHFRSHHAPVSTLDLAAYVVSTFQQHHEIAKDPDLPSLRLWVHAHQFRFLSDDQTCDDIVYPEEAERGYPELGNQWSPGYYRIELGDQEIDCEATLVASIEEWEMMLALPPLQAFECQRLRHEQMLSKAHPSLHTEPGAQLVVAADQFVIRPTGRIKDAAWARAAGDEERTVIAGYHWFADWGRDTMISLEGLTLLTGRHTEASFILRTFSRHLRHGLIPNMFPEQETEGLYNTADASLWYFHAVDRYLAATRDRLTLRRLLPGLLEIVAHHLRGTDFGIGIDPTDGLLRAGQGGFQLTWMDAKVGDWVVTPRRGKAVELNALWYNALKLMERWLREEGDEAGAAEMARRAKQAQGSFNRRFWNERQGYLYDVIDGEQGDDDSCRPNQIFAISLPHPVLDRPRWKPVLDVVTDRLLTPVGLRTLAPGHPDYKAVYFGDIHARDAAYHQGTVWPWLIGPYIDAWLRLHPGQTQKARHFLDGLIASLDDGCVGSLNEVFDAEPPFKPRGCIAQAWSVAEVLRCWALTSG